MSNHKETARLRIKELQEKAAKESHHENIKRMLYAFNQGVNGFSPDLCFQSDCLNYAYKAGIAKDRGDFKGALGYWKNARFLQGTESNMFFN